jgi:hypothetical protein
VCSSRLSFSAGCRSPPLLNVVATAVEVADFMVEADFMAVADFTAAEDFTVGVEEDFAGVPSPVDTAVMAGMVATDGTADVRAIHATVTDGVGEGVLALGGHIGVGDGDTRMATATALGGPIPTITPTITTRLPTIGILTTGTTILRRQVLAKAQRPTQTAPLDLGDLQCREALPPPTTSPHRPRLMSRALCLDQMM